MVITGSGPNLYVELLAQSLLLVFLIQILSIISPIQVIAFLHSRLTGPSRGWASCHLRERIPEIYALHKHRPDRSRHLVRQRYRHQDPGFATRIRANHDPSSTPLHRGSEGLDRHSG